MQLIQTTLSSSDSPPKKCGGIAAALTAASVSLLGSLPAQATEGPWLVDSAVLVYSESDGRVQAVEPIVSMKKDLGDERFLSLKFTFDSLTGASPNGAIPTKETKTFTSPSGRGSYTTTVGALPKNEFTDERSAFNIGFTQPIGDNNHMSIGANYSSEHDYLSDGYNAAFAHDFNSKNTTVSLGFNRESDSNNAVGGIPNPLTANDVGAIDRTVSEDKKVNDILLGVTQVVNRFWLTQLNYSHSTSKGYQNDPYKILSVLDANGNSVKDPLNNNNVLYLYENRPDQRTRNSIFWENKIHLTEDVIDVSLRHYSDSWGIKSNTVDLRYHLLVGDNSYLEPHLRYYNQTAADFYQPFLVSGSDVINGISQLSYASSDPRLAKFTANTIGLKWGYVISRNSEFNIRYEQYKQTGEATPEKAKNMNALSGLKLYSGLTASTVLVGYSFEF